MKKIFVNALATLAMSIAVVSCADYNETNNFKADPDPSITQPYGDLLPVKEYINRDLYPHMSLGATLKATDFNKQALEHAAAITNFDNLTFGTTLMSGSIITERGVMNFLAMNDLLDHVDEIGAEVFGSPIAANANQADAWLNRLTAPIEIVVEPVIDQDVDYSKVSSWNGTVVKGSAPTIEKYNGDNVLSVKKNSQAYIVEGFEVDPNCSYHIVFNARNAEDTKDQAPFITFADSLIKDKKGTSVKYDIKAGKWNKIELDAKPLPGSTKGYIMLSGFKNADILIRNIKISHSPDNHRPQTEQELNDTIHYAMKTWCDGLMKINKGRIKTFDLIDEAIDKKSDLGNQIHDLKHSNAAVFWQDILGSEEYAPTVAMYARDAYARYGNDPAELKFFIAETGLEDPTMFKSLKYWMDIWDLKGAKIDGITAKVGLTYHEDATKQAEEVKAVETLLNNLASTGKYIRISNFDIKYEDAEGEAVGTEAITDAQRQNLANYYALVIKKYMEIIPGEKQMGITKGNLLDTGDPVGLWTKSTTGDWVRNATYKAFCDALSGK